MSDSVRPHRWQPTRLPRPWDSPGKNKNTGVGCHFLLQCRKVKSESEVAQSCPTLCDPVDCSLPGSSVHGIFQARVLEWGAIAFSRGSNPGLLNCRQTLYRLSHQGRLLFLKAFSFFESQNIFSPCFWIIKIVSLFSLVVKIGHSDLRFFVRFQVSLWISLLIFLHCGTSDLTVDNIFAEQMYVV